jgi:hypothetical protein
VDPVGQSAADNNLYRAENGDPSHFADPSGLVGVFFSGGGEKKDATRKVMAYLDTKYSDPRPHQWFGTPGPQRMNAWWKPSELIPLNVVDVDTSPVLYQSLQFVLDAIAVDPCQAIYLFGYSRGGIYTIALAKQLKKLRLRVRFLGAIDPVATGTNYAGATVPDAGKPVPVPGNVIESLEFRKGTADDVFDMKTPSEWDLMLLGLYLSGMSPFYVGPSGGFFQTTWLLGAEQEYYHPATHSQMGYWPSGPGFDAKNDLVDRSRKAGVTWAAGV